MSEQNKLQLHEKGLLARISELELEIKKLKDRKKYGLVWEEKPEDVVLECKENVPILREVKNRKIVSDNSAPNNLLIEGDNYHSLSVLNYTHKGKVDVIYIDPPYNTGATDWKYNNDYVDGNDQWRHSKWISWMNNRLKLAKNLLSKDGVLICAIDHNEQEALGLLFQEIFTEKEIDPIIIIHNPAGIQGKNFSYVHEFAYFIYPKNGKHIGDVSREKELVSPLRDWGGTSARKLAKTCFYPIIIKGNEIIGFGDVCAENFHPKSANIKQKDGSIFIYPIDDHGIERKWVYSKTSAEKNIHQLSIKERDGEFVIIRTKDAFTYRTVWDDKKYYANIFGSKVLNNIIDTNFSFPKSLYTVYDCIKAVVHNKDSAVILDFFAGSGTTGHAVLELNKQDGGNRKFILCTNNENKICEEVTYERIKRISKGYKNKKGEKVEGLGGNLSYYKTDLVNIDKLHKISDESKIKVTYQAGEMIAVREDTLNEIEKNDWWQIFEGNGKSTAIYFKEDKTQIQKLIQLLEKKGMPVVLYVFSWGKNEYRNVLDPFLYTLTLYPVLYS